MIRLFLKSRRVAARPAGFTLVEVMFAVITLGIGLIMIAAIFPIAISQRKTTSEESTAAALAPQAMQIMNEIAAYSWNMNMPATSNTSVTVGTVTLPGPGTVRSLRNPQFDSASAVRFKSTAFRNVSGNLILSADPRLAWIALYRRDGTTPVDPGGIPADTELATWSNIAQIILIAVQARNTSTFTSNDYVNATASGIVNLQPKPIRIAIANNDPLADTITITPSNSPNADYTSAAVQGAYVIVADDGLRAATDNGRMNGRIYKLGTQLSANVFELAPGNDFDIEPDPDGPVANTKSQITSLPFPTPPGGSPPNLGVVEAFIVGRGLTDTTGVGSADNFSGPAMDVAVYTAFVPVH